MIARNKRDIIKNMLLNTFAAAVPVVVLQLIVFPCLGSSMESEQYGLFITILSVFNLIPASLGNALNNIRLLNRKKYEKKNEEGDFQIILFSESIISVALVIVLTLIYSYGFATFLFYRLILSSVICLLWILREYYIVAFLLEINYKHIFTNNIIMATGYLLGLFLFKTTGFWELVYLFGYALSLIHIMMKTNIWKEKFRITSFFKETNKENIICLSASLLYRITSYADKMLLFPIIGGTLVSVYYTATLSGKIISMIITPISGVMLTYLSKMNNSDGERLFNQILKNGSIVCVLTYFVCLFISRPVLGILYPQFVDDAMKLIPITTVTIMLGFMVSMLNPYVLCFLSMIWQLIINAIFAISYVILSFLFMHFWGLMGFCAGCMVSNALRLASTIMIYYKGTRKEP